MTFALLLLLMSFLARPPAPWPTLLAACLTGRRDGIEAFVDAATPVLRAAARRVLLGPRAAGRCTPEDLDDVVQESLLSLFDQEARPLRTYDATRGPLDALLTTIGSRVAHDHLTRRHALKRGGRAGEVLSDPHEGPLTQAPAPGHDPEHALAQARALQALEAQLFTRLSDRGRLFYHLLYVEELDVEAITAGLGVERDVVYSWRKRIKAALGEVLAARDTRPGEAP